MSLGVLFGFGTIVFRMGVRNLARKQMPREKTDLCNFVLLESFGVDSQELSFLKCFP